MSTKWKFTLVTVLSMLIVLSGCSNSQIQEDRINVVTSFYPLYYFTQQIGGDEVNVINLIPTGIEPHDWTPRAQDVVNVSKSQLFIYNGAGLEGWVNDFLGSINKSNMPKTLIASEGLQLLQSGDTGNDHEEEHHHDHSHGGVDPHVWLSPQNAIHMAANIRDSLIAIDADHQTTYEQNYEWLANELQKLHESYKATIDASLRKEVVVSHQALGYLAHDYGFSQLSVMGLSPEAEPTTQDMKNISNFVKENHVKYILFEELASPRIAGVLAGDLGIEILAFNPLEGLTDEQEKSGEDYLSLMRHNLESLKLALQE